MIDWEAVQTEVTDHLQHLLRIDTTNPPGNETRAAEYLSEVLIWEDYEPLITESEPGRGNVTARLQGGPEPPLLLLGHTDVVASEPDKWTYPPFSGAVSDGCIWGRGALDMKNMVAAELMLMVLLKREGIKLNRDVIFAATADEEAGKGEHGPGWLLDNHPEQIAAPFIITEGGGADLHMGNAHFFTCQTGQKGICRMRIRAKGTPGHGSIPNSDNAVVKLCQAMGALDGVQLPMHPGATVQAFIEGIAATQDESTAAMLRDVLIAEKSAAALQDLPLDADLKAQLGAVMRNTASVTMLEAGSKINVIPTEATAWIDGRLTPGQTQESFIAELRPYIGDEVEVEVDQYSPPLEASADTELYRTIVGVMGQQAPEATVIPTISNGGTDAKHIVPRRPDTQVYGFMPYRQTPGLEEMKLIHGHDERTSLENLLFATRVLYDIICRFGGLT